MNEFSDLFATEGLEREQTVSKTIVPDLALDDPMFFMMKPSSASLKKSVLLQRQELVDELVGDCPAGLSKAAESRTLQKRPTRSTKRDELIARFHAGERLIKLENGWVQEFDADGELISAFTTK